MKQPRKIYAPVTDFERAVAKAEGQRLKAKVSEFEQKTSYCPLYLAGKQMLKAKC
jgi:hypothetical protein